MSDQFLYFAGMAYVVALLFAARKGGPDLPIDDVYRTPTSVLEYLNYMQRQALTYMILAGLAMVFVAVCLHRSFQ